MTQFRLCPVSACKLTVPPGKVFCRTHWKMVPQALKDWMLRLYVIGQDGVETDGRVFKFSPHPDWSRAIMEARRAVEEFVRDSRPQLHG